MYLEKLIEKSDELRNKATPGQRKLDNRINVETRRIVAGDKPVCCFCSHWDDENFLIEAKKNDAQFIVHACNTNETLIKIIREMKEALENISHQNMMPSGPAYGAIQEAKETLTKAEELAKEALK